MRNQVPGAEAEAAAERLRPGHLYEIRGCGLLLYVAPFYGKKAGGRSPEALAVYVAPVSDIPGGLSPPRLFI